MQFYMNQSRRIQVEVCTASINSAIAANRAGADRIELCDNLSEGGTTPSAGMIKMCSDLLDLETWVMIRPRGGDFLYNDLEFEVMKRDIELAKDMGASGIVTGILLEDGSVDVERMKEIIRLANPLRVSFHRAIDMCVDPFVALEKLIDIGIVRVLTSGLENKVIDGISMINKLYKQSKGRIEIMMGSGISTSNISGILKSSNVDAVHLTGRTTTKGLMEYQPSQVVLNSFGHEFDFSHRDSDETIISKIVQACR